MAQSCSYTPRNRDGEELKGFRTYMKELGYETAAKVFTRAISPSFKEDYKGILELDNQGVPTYESVVKVPYMRKLIGNTQLIQADQKKFKAVENTRENYQRLLQDAYQYNNSAVNSDTLTAVVTQTDNEDKIVVEIREKTDKNDEEFRNQYGAFLLNQRLVEMLGDLGIDVTLIERNTITDGYVDFSKVKSVADGFAGLINIANGMEGELALSEEAAHVIIGMFRNQPIVQRSLKLLTENQKLVEEILGDDYQANLEYYEQHPNYDILGNEVSLEETMAEEALGHVLQSKLKTRGATEAIEKEEDNTEQQQSKPLNNLVQRLINWIKKVFKGRNSDDIKKAENEVDASMGELAKRVLTGTEKLSKDELIKNQRNARFNRVNTDVISVMKVLQNADEIERKRSQIVDKEQQKDVKKRIVELEALMTDVSKMLGLHTYAKWALTDLQQAMEKLTVSGTLGTHDFKALRHIKSVLDSYSGFIKEFHEVLDELGDEESTIVVGGEEINLRQLWSEINDIYESCSSAFMKQAFTAFSDFLADIYGKSPVRNPDGSIKPLQEILTEQDFDISEFDRWLVSMGTSSSFVLQLFGKAVKNAQDKIRKEVNNETRSVWKIMDHAEELGIKSFEWMYEKDDKGHKTGNYISKYNRGQFLKDKKEMEKNLEDKYGKHPVGENFKKAFAERKAWYEQHANVDIFNNPQPNETYRNKEYDRLSQAQKDLLEEILDYKDSLERHIPPHKRDRYRAIQRRRTGSQRWADSVRDPEKAFGSIKDDIKAAFKKTADDDAVYGESTKGLTDFTGQEYMTIPVIYTSRLENPDNLSTDIFGDLMCYAYMAHSYTEMSQIYDPLAIGVDVMANKEFTKRKDRKIKEETINFMGRVTKKPVIMKNNTNFEKKLRDYLECQVYGRYMKEDDVISANTQKKIGVFQKLTSTAYLGCNYLQGLANIATAVGMQNIEAAAREFFNAKELASADIEYGKMLPAFIAELGDRKKQSELALFDELFDVRQNYKDKLHNVKMKSIFRRFFGQNWAFIQQGMGDHWIYNRTALAMAKHKKVSVNGKIMSVWEAREIVTDENGYKKMQIKEGARNVTFDKNGKAIVGELFDAYAFGREIAHINHTIAGIYNDEDANAANRVIVGRLAQQMRKWIVPQMMRRFQSKRMVIDIGKEEEGYYRTAARLAKDIWLSGFKITAEWDKLSDSDKANVRRAMCEIIQTYSLWLLMTLIGSGVKDPERSWAAQLAEYMLNREIHELGFLTPGPMMATEGYKTLTSPFVVASSANKVAQAMLTTMWPGNWFPDDDELVKSGKYKGHSYIYKRWAELPLPFLAQWRQLDKFIEDLETSTKFYSKDYK